MPCEGSFQLLRGSFLAYLVPLQPGAELPLAYADALSCAPAGRVAFELAAGTYPFTSQVHVRGGQSLRVIGAGPDQTILDPQGEYGARQSLPFCYFAATAAHRCVCPHACRPKPSLFC